MSEGCESEDCDNSVDFEALEIPYGSNEKYGYTVTKRCNKCRKVMEEGSQLYSPGVGIKWKEASDE